jgi:hypothetical protein
MIDLAHDPAANPPSPRFRPEDMFLRIIALAKALSSLKER